MTKGRDWKRAWKRGAACSDLCRNELFALHAQCLKLPQDKLWVIPGICKESINGIFRQTQLHLKFEINNIFVCAWTDNTSLQLFQVTQTPEANYICRWLSESWLYNHAKDNTLG